MKNILAIGAHPDDIEVSCLGYLLKENKEKNSKILIDQFFKLTGIKKTTILTSLKT